MAPKVATLVGVFHDHTIIAEGSPDKARLITVLINVNTKRHPDLHWVSYGNTPENVRSLHRDLRRGSKIKFDVVKSRKPIGPDGIPQLGAFAYTIIK